MLGLLIMFLVSNVWYLLTTPIRRRMPNPAMLRCSACGAKMYLRPIGWGSYISNIVAQMVLWMIAWQANPPFLVGMAMLIVVTFPLGIAMDRIYHTLWRWRHPLRCGEGGHFVPAPTKA